MKLKKVSLIVFSLLLALSAVHAVPVDPSSGNNPPASNSEDVPVTLFSKDSKNPVQIFVGQPFSVILAITPTSYFVHDFYFSDSSLFGANTIPYTFDFIGRVVDYSEGKVTIDCANMAKEANDPVVYQRGAITSTYLHFDDDATTTPDDNYYTSVLASKFNFIGNTPGTTTLTFSDGPHTYSYPITVVAAPAN